MVVSRGCGDWRDECCDAFPDDLDVTCGDQYLTCGAAKQAAVGTAVGVVGCYRACMGFN
jgi:hypothetical protein